MRFMIKKNTVGHEWFGVQWKLPLRTSFSGPWFSYHCILLVAFELAHEIFQPDLFLGAAKDHVNEVLGRGEANGPTAGDFSDCDHEILRVPIDFLR